MTQFAVFTGSKPEFTGFEFVPLLEDRIKNYVGSSLSESEKLQSWVIHAPTSEPIDEMCGEAMVPAQVNGNIQNTVLFSLLSVCIKNCKAITFIYGTYSSNMPVYTDSALFLNAITTSLSKPPFQVYAKYSAS